MKKKLLLSLIFTFIIIVAGYTISNAATYETDTFKVNIPNYLKVKKTQYGIDAENNNNTVGIIIESTKPGEQTNNGIIPNQSLLEYLIAYMRSTHGYNFTVISSKLVETNGCQGLELQFRDINSGYYIYGDCYKYYSDNYIYNIVIISYDKSYLNSAEKNGIINSLKVKDTVRTTNGIPFTDVKKSDWYYNSVRFVSNNKIISGTTNYTYNPNGKLTRGMLATILWRMEGMPKATGGKNFNDVKSGQYYYEAIKWASSKKIVNGYSDTKFGPNNNITREQLAVMLNNYAKYKKKNVNNLANISGYADSKNVTAYAKTAVQWAIKNKIISGKSNGTKIDPKGNATRAEVAGMIESYCSYVGR